jgi:hypothetical protein
MVISGPVRPFFGIRGGCSECEALGEKRVRCGQNHMSGDTMCLNRSEHPHTITWVTQDALYPTLMIRNSKCLLIGLIKCSKGKRPTINGHPN